jgi:hypothetical protein
MFDFTQTGLAVLPQPLPTVTLMESGLRAHGGAVNLKLFLEEKIMATTHSNEKSPKKDSMSSSKKPSKSSSASSSGKSSQSSKESKSSSKSSGSRSNH